MRFASAMIFLIAVLCVEAAYSQEEKKSESGPTDPAVMTEEQALNLYYELGGKLNSAIEKVADGVPMFLGQIAILADNSPVFSEADKKLLDETGVAYFSYTYYYEEIINLLPPKFETPKELIPIFSDEKRLSRIKSIVEALTVLSASVSSKIDALIDRLPSSNRVEKWASEARANYESAKK